MKLPVKQKTQFSLIYLLIAVLVLSLVQSWLLAPRTVEIPMSKFLALVREGKVERVSVTDREIRGTLKPGALPAQQPSTGDKVRNLVGADQPITTFTTTRIPGIEDSALVKELEQYKVEFSGRVESTFWRDFILGWIVPLALMVGLWMFVMRRMGGGPTQALSFGRSKAKIYDRKELKTTFADVAGVEEAKAELMEVVDFLKNPKKYQRLGGRIPKGVLLVGPPGTGKTLLARAVAGEANVPFFSISGSDFVEMFGGGHDEREQTLNQLLVEMDGFESNDGVILVAATNRPDVLDPALLRPGRFDRRVIVDRPDIRGREEVLKVHSRKVPMAEDVNLNVLARGTPGFSGADLANMVNEAALTAARYNRKSVHMYDFEVAKDKVMMGAERKSMLLTDEEKRVTAYHEAGHTLVSALREHSDPLHKVTIIPRGLALGVTVYLPEEDQHTVTKDYLETRLATLMGGRCAEEIFLKQMTTGAGSDIERSTELARKMVCEFGMSKMGPMTFGKKEEQIFLGREIAQHRDFSDDTAKQIDAEVRAFVDTAYKSAYTILESNQDIMHRMASALLERETLDANEIKLIIEGKELPATKSALSGVAPGSGGETQKVLKPEGGRKPGFGENQPSPA